MHGDSIPGTCLHWNEVRGGPAEFRHAFEWEENVGSLMPASVIL